MIRDILAIVGLATIVGLVVLAGVIVLIARRGREAHRYRAQASAALQEIGW